MLPAEIEAYIQGHPDQAAGYQNFKNWVAAGAMHPSWSAAAEAAAAAAGIGRANPNVVGHRDTVWGEGQELDANGNVISGYNPAYIPWLQAWDTAHPGQTMGSTAPAAPVPSPMQPGMTVPDHSKEWQLVPHLGETAAMADIQNLGHPNTTNAANILQGFAQGSNFSNIDAGAILRSQATQRILDAYRRGVNVLGK